MTYCCKPVLRILLKMFFFHSILTMSLVILTISDIIRVCHIYYGIER